VNGSYGMDTGLGIWLKSLGLKETLKLQTKQANSQSRVMQQNIQKIEDAFDERLEKILRPVNKSPQRTRGATSREPEEVDLETTKSLEEYRDDQELEHTYSEPAKSSEEDRKDLGPDDPEFLSWLKQFGGRERRRTDTAPHLRPSTPGNND
jgi:hypothetical protein